MLRGLYLSVTKECDGVTMRYDGITMLCDSVTMLCDSATKLCNAVTMLCDEIAVLCDAMTVLHGARGAGYTLTGLRSCVQINSINKSITNKFRRKDVRLWAWGHVCVELLRAASEGGPRTHA
jgi:hypothetical protein